MHKALKRINNIYQPVLYLLIFILLIIQIPVSSMSSYNDDILLLVHDREITKIEFQRFWNTNNFDTQPQSIDDYLELFINFHLKIVHARNEEIHLDHSFQKELSGYRKKMAIPFMGDPDTEEKLVKEAYERLLYDINASHILIRLPYGYKPEDTLIAFNKAMQIRERIFERELFERVALATSDDPSAKINSGNLGYFTVFHMVYPFENAVYKLRPGEISMPVRTQFGYHIIRVNEKLKSRGEIKTAHIMIGLDQHNEQQAKEKITEIYEGLVAGYSFEVMARDHSTDINSASQGGVLPWFGSGRYIPDFEQAAFALEKPGDISKPVLTNYGWHIIKLLDHREILPFDEIKKKFLDRVRDPMNDRFRIIKDAMVERLKKEWEISENPGALDTFYNLIDNRVLNGSWTMPDNWQLNQVMFTLNGVSVTQKDFADFISENAYDPNSLSVDEYIYTLYLEFVASCLIEHEERNLENKYQEFRYIMQEYEDWMLLFEITDREVWSRALNDSAGLSAFHENNRNEYMWDKRISASIFITEEPRIANRAARRASRSIRSERMDDNWIIAPLNRRNEEDVITVEKGIYSMGDKEITDRVEWTEGVSEIFKMDDGYKIVLIHKIIDPEPKTLEEARKKVMEDYQDYLGEKWLQELRNKYNVIVNKAVLSTIN